MKLAMSAPSSSELKIDRLLSGPATYGYLAAGIGLPFIEGDHNPSQQAWRGGDAVLSSVAISEGLKRLTRVPRPDTSTPDAFPSGHAAATFAMATVRATLRPGQAWEWYAGSTIISASRVRLNRHTIPEVLAGAALGFGIAKFELAQRNGLLLHGIVDAPTRDLQNLTSSGTKSWHPLLDPFQRRLGLGYSVRF